MAAAGLFAAHFSGPLGIEVFLHAPAGWWWLSLQLCWNLPQWTTLGEVVTC